MLWYIYVIFLPFPFPGESHLIEDRDLSARCAHDEPLVSADHGCCRGAQVDAFVDEWVSRVAAAAQRRPHTPPHTHQAVPRPARHTAALGGGG